MGRVGMWRGAGGDNLALWLVGKGLPKVANIFILFGR